MYINDQHFPVSKTVLARLNFFSPFSFLKKWLNCEHCCFQNLSDLSQGRALSRYDDHSFYDVKQMMKLLGKVGSKERV